MWLIAIFGLAILASYGGMPEPAAGWVRIISLIGLVASIIVAVRNLIKSNMEFREKHKAPEGRERISHYYYGQEIDTPQRRKELMKWNERHLDSLYEGPINETPALRSLRLSLLTTEQLSRVPFEKRIAIRNMKRHAFFVSSSARNDCHVCGKTDSHVLCDECAQRYKTDLANGWEETIPPVFRTNPSARRQLWILQQCVAIDLMDGVISEATAKAEMQEVVEVARQEIAEIERQELERKVDIQHRKNQQSELSDIVKRLS